MDSPKEQCSTSLNVEPWELALVSIAAARIRTTDREELEAELCRHLLRVKARHYRRVRYWKAYLRKALENKAKNWIRDRNLELSVMTSADTPDSTTSPTLVDRVPAGRPGPEAHAAFTAAWDDLPPKLQQLWQVLLEENGNQTRAAKRLKIHRNTARIWTRRIQQIVRTHGL